MRRRDSIGTADIVVALALAACAGTHREAVGASSQPANESGHSTTAESRTQGQVKFTWPATYSLARAYLDQLERSKGLDKGQIAAARDALAKAEKAKDSDRQKVLADLATRLSGDGAQAVDAIKVRMDAGVVKQLETEPGLALH